MTVDEHLALLREIEPVLEELVTWHDLDHESALEEQARGDAILRRVRDVLEAASGPARIPHQGDYEPPEIDDWRPGDARPAKERS